MAYRTERPPRLVQFLLLGSFIAQLLFASQRPDYIARARELPAAPPVGIVRLATLAEPVTAAALLMLWLQAFDNPPGISIPFNALDYHNVIAWLDVILTLNPRFNYPLLSASRLYTEVPDTERKRLMLGFVYEKFFNDPNRYWPWLAHAVYVAKHRLHDHQLALSFARALRLNATAKTVPAWVSQMEILVYEDRGDWEAASRIIDGLLASGRIAPGSNEERFLLDKLTALRQQ